MDSMSILDYMLRVECLIRWDVIHECVLLIHRSINISFFLQRLFQCSLTIIDILSLIRESSSKISVCAVCVVWQVAWLNSLTIYD